MKKPTEQDDVVGVILASIVKSNGSINKREMQKYLDYMFVTEPIAACLRDYCNSRHFSTSVMYQLIALGFMSEKTRKLTEEWLKSHKEMSKV